MLRSGFCADLLAGVYGRRLWLAGVPLVRPTINTTGYTARAKKLGYRMVAAVSGTTGNVLQYGYMLGFTPSQMVLLRLTMAAWMLPTVRSLAPPFPPLNPC